MAERLSRPDQIRQIGTARWKPLAAMEPGDWHFNSHHSLYQFALRPGGKLFVLTPQFVEWHAAQLRLWDARLEQARDLVNAALGRPGLDRRRG